MTKEEILQEFSDINNVYNNCTRYDTLKHMLDELTEPKTGHWIEHPHEAGSNWELSMYECSGCHTWAEDDSDYCPSCGAKMLESEGRDDKR